MRRPLDPYQAAKARQQYDVQYQALLRQDEVIRHYQSKQYEIVCDDDVATRKAFGIAAGPVADLVVRVDQNHAIIAEVKGKDLDHALEQLAATVEPVRKKFHYIACKVFTAIPVPRWIESAFPERIFRFSGTKPSAYFTGDSQGNGPC